MKKTRNGFGHLYFEKSFTLGVGFEHTIFSGFGVGFIVGKRSPARYGPPSEIEYDSANRKNTVFPSSIENFDYFFYLRKKTENSKPSKRTSRHLTVCPYGVVLDILFPLNTRVA